MARLMTSLVAILAICTTIMVSQIVVAEPPAAAAGSEIQCWAALLEIKGCVESIKKALHGRGIVEVERACCEAFLAIAENCWPKMFPFHPIVPPKLVAFCSALAAAPAPI